MVDVVVVGAGISGAATAYNLVRDGLSVVLVDRFGPAAMASGWTLAGVRQSGRHLSELPLAQAAVEMWGTLSDELAGDTHYRRSGNLRVACTEAEVAIIERVVREQSALGLEISLLASNREVREVAPALSENVLVASHCLSDGSADPHATVAAFIAAGQRLGLECRFGERVEALETEGERLVAVRTDKGRIATERAVVAAGVFGNELLAPFGVHVPLTIPMVTVLRSEPLDHSVVDQVVSSASQNFAGRQEFNGRWRVTNGELPWHGDLTETTDAQGRPKPSVAPTVATIADVVNRFSEVVPAFREARIVDLWAGLIDLTPDALPVFDAIPGCRGATLAMGFSGHGFCLGPITGRIMADLVQERPSNLPLDAFKLDRLAGMATSAPLSLHG